MCARPRGISDRDVLDATARAIGRLGPARLTLAEVARDAGVSPATLVQRFGSKRGLLLAFARQAGEVLSEAFRAARDSYASPLRALLAVSLAQTRTMESPEVLSNHLAFRQMDLNDPEFRRLAAAAAARTRDELRALLDEAVEVGELTPCDTSALGRAIHAVANGSIVSWSIDRKGTAERWVRKDLETLLAPYRLRKTVTRGKS